MKIIDDINAISHPFPKPVVTIGNFDGVHRGHQALFKTVIEKARELNGTAVAVTFEPHPIKVLKPENCPPQITLLEQKMELIESCGLDALICIPFDKNFAEISAHDFVKQFLVERIGTVKMVVGDDYNFGKNREGDVALLKKYAIRYGFEVTVCDWHTIDGGDPEKAERISSTRVREVIQAGRVEEAPDMLGRFYQIRGEVVRGRDRGGKVLGFPTANIRLVDELCPKVGVYAVTVDCSQGRFKGVANIGYSPTFDDCQFTVEVHILDFDARLYGQKIRVNFVGRLRDEKRFSGIAELSEQIRKDIESARNLLYSVHPEMRKFVSVQERRKI